MEKTAESIRGREFTRGVGKVNTLESPVTPYRKETHDYYALRPY